MIEKIEQIKMPNGEIYELSSGSDIEANPEEPSTQILSKIKIDNIVYSLPSGGFSGLPANLVTITGVLEEEEGN